MLVIAGGFMITGLCRDRINQYDDENSRWRLANSILYGIVKEYPMHNDEDEIVSKLWIIGRAYAATIERRRNRENTPGDFYYDYIAQVLLESEIDTKIDSIRHYHTITNDNLPEILVVHKYLVDLFNLTEMNKRSLASKYLHFHLPELFFIYDSRVESVITEFSGRIPHGYATPDYSDRQYAVFCYKALQIYNELNGDYSDVKPRVVDNILLRYCDEINR